MRFKEFIIFLIIFTIIYITIFVIYDYFSDKKSNKNLNDKKENLFNLDTYLMFAKFYDINPVANIDIIKALLEELKTNFDISLSEYSNKYQLSTMELIVIIMYLEYYDYIKKREIFLVGDCTKKLDARSEEIALKYSLFLSNKFDYNTIIERAGLNSDKELEFLNEKYLFPGVRIVDKTINYYGDDNEN